MAAPVSVPLLDHFAALPDPRQLLRYCIRSRKSGFYFLPRRSRGRTISTRRRCGEPSIRHSSDASTPAAAASLLRAGIGHVAAYPARAKNLAPSFGGQPSHELTDAAAKRIPELNRPPNSAFSHPLGNPNSIPTETA